VKSQKKYVQLYSNITDAIRNGTYSSGDKLPPELDLAKQYGISRQTVRLALEKLENDGFISKLQGSGSYITDSSLTLKKTMRIGVITTYISTYIFPLILRGIENVAASNHYSLMLSATNNSIAKEREILHNISENSVDGIIVEGTKTALPNPNLSFYKALADKNIPLVFINGYYPALLDEHHDKIVYAVTEDYQGSYDLTLDLVKMGHRSIGGIFKSDDIQGIRRFSGYIDALTDDEIPINDGHVMWFNTETKFSVEQQLAQSKMISECTAIVCYNDEIALQFLAFLKNHPSKVTALRSFDGTLPPHQSGIDFRSLNHPKETMGNIAANKLFRIINGGSEENCIFPWE